MKIGTRKYKRIKFIYIIIYYIFILYVTICKYFMSPLTSDAAFKT